MLIVVNQDDVVSQYCKIQWYRFLSFSSSKSGLLQVSAVPEGQDNCSCTEPQLALSPLPTPQLNVTVLQQNQQKRMCARSQPSLLTSARRKYWLNWTRRSKLQRVSLAHAHFASLTAIRWLSAQMHCDQLGATMAYFQKKQCLTWEAYIQYAFYRNELDTPVSNNWDNSLIFPFTLVYVLVHLRYLEACLISKGKWLLFKTLGEERCTFVHSVSDYSIRKSVIC